MFSSPLYVPQAPVTPPFVSHVVTYLITISQTHDCLPSQLNLQHSSWTILGTNMELNKFLLKEGMTGKSMTYLFMVKLHRVKPAGGQAITERRDSVHLWTAEKSLVSGSLLSQLGRGNKTCWDPPSLLLSWELTFREAWSYFILSLLLFPLWKYS